MSIQFTTLITLNLLVGHLDSILPLLTVAKPAITQWQTNHDKKNCGNQLHFTILITLNLLVGHLDSILPLLTVANQP
jgi:hypothetical protein